MIREFTTRVALRLLRLAGWNSAELKRYWWDYEAGTGTVTVNCQVIRWRWCCRACAAKARRGERGRE